MPKNRLLAQEQWKQFSQQLHLEESPATQRTEMRRAFYAGAQAILFRVIQVLAPESEPTEADLQIMKDLEQELLAFFMLVKAGLA
jgi:hypothetical protein